MADFTLRSAYAVIPDKVYFNIESTGYLETVSITIGMTSCQAGATFTEWFTYDKSYDVSIGEVNLSLSGLYFYFTGEEYKFCVKFSNGRVLDTTVFLPLSSQVFGSYLISERPTQQSQSVFYNNNYSGEAGCCVACAVASLKEIQEIRNKKEVLNYSVGWFYGKTGDSSGTDTRVALSALRNGGIPPYQVVQNNSGVFDYPDIYFYPEARQVYKDTGDIPDYSLPQKIRDYTLISPYENTLEEVFSAIRSNSKVVLVTIVSDMSFEGSQAKSTGRVPPITGTYGQGHLMVVIGWTIIGNAKYWVCQNSWCRIDKTPYGDNGLFYLPFNWGAYTVATGIRGFYIVEDDPSAPVLPDLPLSDKMKPPYAKADSRQDDQITLYSDTYKGATKYRVTWTEKDTTNKIQTISTDLSKPTYTLSVYEGGKYGYTYTVYVEAYVKGTWIGKSDSAEITFLPCTPDIKSVYSTTDNNLIVEPLSVYTNRERIGKFSIIRIFRGIVGSTNTGDGSYLEYKDTDSYDKTVEFKNLAKGSSWGFVARSALIKDNVYLWSYYRSEEYVGKVGKMLFFEWDTPKIKGEKFNVTAIEWNKLLDKINEIRAYKNISPYNFNKVNIDNIFTAQIYNEAGKAIKEITGYGTYIPVVKKNDKITADINSNKPLENVINIIVNELNAII